MTVAALVFIVLRIIPGDPVELMLGENAGHLQSENLRKALGLDRPLFSQLIDFFSHLIRGDLGTSIAKKRSVTALLLERIPFTFLLAITSTALANIIGISAGMLSANLKIHQKYPLVRSMINGFTLLFLSVPNFWLGPLLVIAFSLHWPWLPVSSFSDMRSLILPSLTLGLGLSASLCKTTETSVLECLRSDYLQTARAKGNSEIRALVFHALPNALIPILMVSTLQFGSLLAGAVVTESIFDWPGMGSLAFEAISSRDYPVVQGTVLVISFSYILTNLITELVRLRFTPTSEQVL